MTTTLSALLKRSTITDHEEAVKICNATLKQSRGDLQALHIKAVGLIKLERYEDVLRLFEEGGDSLKSLAQLEYAYALYKTGDLEQAQDVANGINSRGARHVEAQASYRREDLLTSRRLYTGLVDSSEEENDVRINGSAVDAQLEWNRQGHLASRRKADREDLETFELAYNAACGCIARGELQQGQILLKRAKDLCNSSSELTEDEKASERLPIAVQQLYILCALVKLDDVEALLAEINIEDISDLSTRQSAQINKLTALPKSMNPYLAHRIFHSFEPLPKSDKRFGFQEDIFRQNDTTLELLISKFKGVIRSTARYLSNHSQPSISISINSISSANAAAHAQNQTGNPSLKAIIPLLEKRPKEVGLVITIVQLYIQIKNYGSAITTLEAFFKQLEDSDMPEEHSIRYAPGLVAVLVALYSVQGRKSAIRTELAKAASYWRQNSISAPALFRAAGLALIRTGKEDDLLEAGKIFDALYHEDQKDRLAKAGLVAAYATTQPSKVAEEVKELAAINRLTTGVDISSLEKAGVPQAAPTAANILSRKRPAADDTKPAKKRIRKSRLPKDYDPAKKPDPERWLPLRDRSTYKPRGKKGKQKQAALTQGGVNEKAAEGLNANTENAKTTVVSGGGGGGKAKKKKPKK